jgi:hypothetical protein
MTNERLTSRLRGDAKLILDRLHTVSDDDDLVELLLEAGALAHMMQIDAFLHVPCSGRYSGDEDVSGCATKATKAADFLNEVRAVDVDRLQGDRDNKYVYIFEHPPRSVSDEMAALTKRMLEKGNG